MSAEVKKTALKSLMMRANTNHDHFMRSNASHTEKHVSGQAIVVIGMLCEAGLGFLDTLGKLEERLDKYENIIKEIRENEK